METFKFTTTLKCGGCVQKVSGFLNENENIKSWNVDLDNNPKILTVESDKNIVNEIIEGFSKAGYKAELLP